MGVKFCRLLDIEYDDPYMNIALEEVIMRCVGKRVVPCTLRFWRNLKAVVIGSFQRPELEIDFEACKGMNIPVVRRISGGGAVYHDGGNLNYSIIMPKSNLFQKIFENVGLGVASALRSLGLNVEHPSRNTLLVRKRKISGLAGAVKYGAILVHGSILINSDLRVLYEVLGFNRVALKVDGVRKYTRSQRQEVTNLEAALGRRISLTELKRTLAKAFENQFSMHLKEDCLTECEKRLVRKLYEDKYSSNHWNLKYSNLLETA